MLRLAILVALAAIGVGLTGPSETAGAVRPGNTQTARHTVDVVERPFDQSFQLSMTQGEPSGPFAAGSVVDVFGLISPLGRVFERWEGETSLLGDARGLHTRLTMPAADVVLTATFRAVPVWLSSSESIDGRRVFSYFPPAHKGTIAFFHGAGGNSSGWFDKSVEQRMFLKDAVVRGYAVLATESEDRSSGTWNLSPGADNGDLRHVINLLSRLRRQGKLGAGEPVYAVGLAGGADFALLAAPALGAKAIALYGSAGPAAHFNRSVTPTMWCLAERDSSVDATVAAANAARLAARGIPSRQHMNLHAPAYTLRFTRIEGVTSQISREIHRDMEVAGVLAADGTVLLDPTLHPDQVRRAVFGEFVGYTDAILDQLTVAYAQHAFYSDANHLVLDFFDAELDSAPRPTPTDVPEPTATPPPTRWYSLLPWAADQ